MKKNLLVSLLVSLLVFTVVGCGSETTVHEAEEVIAKEVIDEEAPIIKQEETEEAPKVGMTDKMPRVVPEQLTFDIERYDEYGTHWGAMTFTNNSDHTITMFNVIFEDIGTNEIVYFFNNMTVLPNEISPKCENMITENGLEPLKLEYTILDKETSLICLVTYDIKAELLTWSPWMEY